MRLVLNTALVFFAAASVASAQRSGGLGPLQNAEQPLLLRLEGVIQPTKAAARRSGFTVTSLGFAHASAEDERWLGVTKVRTVGGDQVLNGQDVLNAVAPFEPNLFVVGPDDLLAKLRDAPPGTAVRVEGIVTRSSRTYFLRRVEPGAG